MKLIILCAVIASAYAGVVQHHASAPQTYSHSIPAAAIRNVETVGVTKTITPVVTKTTTTQTHSEPAVSVGHVQGYTQSAHGAPSVQPVQYNTQYTSYQNPTVGVNGPVTYAGPSHAVGVAEVPVQAVEAVQPVHNYHHQPAYASLDAPVQAYDHQPSILSGPPAHQSHGHNFGGLYAVQPSYSAASIQPQFLFGAQLSGLSYQAAPVIGSHAEGHHLHAHADQY